MSGRTSGSTFGCVYVRERYCVVFLCTATGTGTHRWNGWAITT